MGSELVHRVLDRTAVTSLDEWASMGGGNALVAAAALGTAATIDELEASGLRGRGGAGFPTATKWRTIAAYTGDVVPTVVVNAAEGEPGSYKDRAIIERNPYRVLEGALVAAHTIGASRVVVATKEHFTVTLDRLRAAVTEIGAAGWTDSVTVDVVTGPSAYLFGEETGLLEVVEGRHPFPRVSPPWRFGIEDAGEDDSNSAADIDLASPDASDSEMAPTLVDNVETLAHVCEILARGAGWFRELGTDESPGTVVCTISGATTRSDVGEVALGTSLRDAIDLIGGGMPDGSAVGAVLSGVSNPVLTAADLDTPLTYEAMVSIGTGLGSVGFIVFDAETDPLAIAQGVAHFLAVESCGQCAHCKRDGLAIDHELQHMSEADPTVDVAALPALLDTVADGARCNLALQQRDVTGSFVARFPHAFEADRIAVGAPVTIAPIHDLRDGTAVLDERAITKQPDWSHDAVDSGAWPIDRLGSVQTG